jgi:hypothetical protein
VKDGEGKVKRRKEEARDGGRLRWIAKIERRRNSMPKKRRERKGKGEGEGEGRASTKA